MATLDRTLTAIASVPSFAPDVDCLGRHCDRQREGPGRLRVLTRHPDVALRPRAAERVQLGRGEVLPQRDPRGRPARGLPGRDRVPARRGRAPSRRCSRRRAPTTTPTSRTWRRCCSSGASTGRRRCPPGRSSALSPKGGHSQLRPIFSTTRPKCTGCSPGSKAGARHPPRAARPRHVVARSRCGQHRGTSARPRAATARPRPDRPGVRAAAGRRGTRPGRAHVARATSAASSAWRTASRRTAT